VLGVESGATAAARQIRTVSVAFTRYWRAKVIDPTRHAGTHGGKRWTKLPAEINLSLELHLWSELRRDPTTDCAALAQSANQAAGLPLCDRYSVSRILRKWGWSWKITGHKQIAKYAVHNMEWYCRYVFAIRLVPWHRLRYLDESHFESRSLRRKKGAAQIGRAVTTLCPHSIAESYSITMVLNPTNTACPVIVSNFRVQTNRGEDFLVFIESCIESGQFTAGDIIVADNAAVHTAAGTAERLGAALDQAGLRLAFLPAYSRS